MEKECVEKEPKTIGIARFSDHQPPMPPPKARCLALFGVMETLERGDKGGLFAGIVVRRNLSRIAKEIIKPLLQRCAIA